MLKEIETKGNPHKVYMFPRAQDERVLNNTENTVKVVEVEVYM